MSGRTNATRLSPEEGVKSFQEIESTLTPVQATIEASRCLICENPPCNIGCPAGIDIRGFIRKIRFNNPWGGIRVLREANILSGVCGRVCPTEALCEEECRSQVLTEPINIAALQRYLIDLERERGPRKRSPAAQREEKVAIIGAGPAGLAAANELALLGYSVTVFEGSAQPGGAMVSAIPSFKLPDDIVEYEIDQIKKLGVQFKLDTPLSEKLTIDDLFEQGYEAVFLAVGLQKPFALGIEGEDLEGVYTALDVLAEATGQRSSQPVKIGKRVVIIGGGSVAMTAACSAVRMGAERTTVVCLEAPDEMPAFAEDVLLAWEEGVQFITRARALRFLGDGQGQVAGIEGVHIEWKQSGSFVPENAVDLEGSGFTIPCDTVIVAIGQGPDENAIKQFQGLKTNPRGYLLVDEETLMTSRPGVFAGGDILHNPASRTVVQAVAYGKQAAQSIHQY
ncbi:MAG TPA: FAD-binding protein, partial [Chloroflexi bacterium]|nr:FAD-binding protein [Chloroflexota bacterium]